MKHLHEYRDRRLVQNLVRALSESVTKPWTLMEVCGGQTHSILRHGIDELLPKGLELIHGPGCPVCVTPAVRIDQSIELATQHNVILCTFGDMLRVPGSTSDLQQARARGGDLRVVYSPLDAVELASREPSREVVFLAVGFETTTPATAIAVLRAQQRGLQNFSILCSHVLVPPAMEAILQSPQCRVQGFLAAGHVCTITGLHRYRSLSAAYRVPIVATGFEPVDLLSGILQCVKMLEQDEIGVTNAYARSVAENGNPAANQMVDKVFQPIDFDWRGLGRFERSGLVLRPEFERFDALQRFQLTQAKGCPSGECRAGDVMQGVIQPPQCPAFGTRCRPDSPLGAPMVSGEGACAAYYRYRSDLPVLAPAGDAT